jgi:hypothetical protein
MTVLRNKANGQIVTLHFNANAGPIVVAGNNSVSNIALAGENVFSASISKLWFGSQAGAWIITRGNTTVNSVVGVYNNTDRCFYDEGGEVLDLNKDKDLWFTLVGTANGYIMCQLKKNN